ncbi:Ig-like domain-containing protein [Anaerovorax odorimutans]|uniref:Ig-like domain-containing protein n=1 Tax=Anaerovorax odorimutans TaxID=109327 RepID=A0ABT1RJH6_9FIRM|nr:Ig-like domain-containing protein [Anaerovorax odorimutans]MCQ4635333.1 Ig-like domain-containing protein [Anaerovorax odorimutans]
MEARKKKSSRLLAWVVVIAVAFTMTLPSSFVWAAETGATQEKVVTEDQTPTEAPAVEESSNKDPTEAAKAQTTKKAAKAAATDEVVDTTKPHVNQDGSKTHNAGTVFFAEGYPVTITEAKDLEDGKVGFTASWKEGEEEKSLTVSRDAATEKQPVAAANMITVVGGTEGLNDKTDLDTTKITVKSGVVDYVVGGNFNAGKVKTADITVEGGTIGIVHGATRDLPNNTYANRKEKASIDTVNMTISGGDMEAVIGGTFGYTYVKDVNVTISGGTIAATTSPMQAGILLGGTNGEVENATLNFSGGKTKDIALGQRVMITGKTTLNLTGGNAGNIYAGSYYDDGDNAAGTENWGTWGVGSVNYGQAAAIDMTLGGNLTYNDVYAGFQFVDKDAFAEKYKTSISDISGSEKAPINISVKKAGEAKRGTAEQHTVSMLEKVFPSETLTIETSLAEGKVLDLQEGCTVVVKDGVKDIKAKTGAADVTLQASNTYTVKDGKLASIVAKIGNEGYLTLQDAIEAARAGDTVKLNKDISVDMGKDKTAPAILIDKSITLDGNGKTITAKKSDGAEDGMGHVIGVQNGAKAAIKNLTVDGNNKAARHGIQTYGDGSEANLTSITVKNCFGYGVVANGSSITATRLTTNDNGWGGVNVTKGANVTTEPRFEFNSGNLNEANPIQADNVDKSEVSKDYVNFGKNAGDWYSVNTKTDENAPAIQWKQGIAPAEGEAKVGTLVYATLKEALEAATDGETVTLTKDITVDMGQDANAAAIAITKNITLVGNNHTITAKQTDATKAAKDGLGHVIGVQNGAVVTIENLTVNGNQAAKHGIQTYGENSYAELNNVTVKDCKGYGAVANGSTIIANDLYASGNGWGGVNVSKGSGVETDPSFTLYGGELQKENPIQADNVDGSKVEEAWVDYLAGDWYKVVSEEGKVINWKQGIEIDSVALNAEKSTLTVGDKEQLIAKVIPEDAYNREVKWASSDEKKATVNEQGIVTAVSATGDTPVTITATAANGEKAECEVTIKAATAEGSATITIQPSLDEYDDFNTAAVSTAIENAKTENIKDVVIVMPTEIETVPEDVFEIAKKNTVGKLVIKAEAANRKVGDVDVKTCDATFEFDTKDINKLVSVNTDIVLENMNDVPSSLPEDSAVEKIRLEHEGDFPAPATITLSLTNQKVQEGQKGYLYYENGDELTLIDHGIVEVKANKEVAITLTHASEYVFSTKQMEPAIAADSVENSIKNIGKVVYSAKTGKAIKTARSAYNGFKEQYAGNNESMIRNISTLNEAEKAYQILDDQVQAVKAAMAKFDNFEDSVLTYDQQKQIAQIEADFAKLDKNQKAVMEEEDYGQGYVDYLVELSKASQNREAVSQANRVSKLADQLPATATYSAADKSKIDAARNMYNSVVAETPATKALLTADLAKIQKAETEYRNAKRTAYNNVRISLSTTQYTYNGGAKTPAVYGLSAFVNGRDYSVAYKNNVKTGKATVTVTAIGDCAGLSAKTATFRITPAKAAISKLKKGKKSFKVTIKSQKSAGVSGYQISYSLKKNKSFKSTTTTKTSKTVKKLKAKKNYYVKVRSYKTIDGKKYYGAYSKVKKIKTK